MNKEIVVCSIIVILIISIDIISNNYTKRIVSTMNEKLEATRQEMKSVSDKSKIDNNIQEIEKYWNNNYKVLSFYIEHDELEKVSSQVTMIKGNAEMEEYGQAVPQLDQCVFLLNHIKDKEKLLIRNIF